jgi:hypothetical protein
MGRQQALPLDAVPPQDALWSQVCTQDQRKVVEIFARLVAHTVHGETGKEDRNDNSND